MALPNNHGSWWREVITSSTKDELTLAVCVTILLATLWYKIKFSSSSNGAPSLPPGPRSLPIVGYIPFLRPDLHKQLTEMSHTYGPIFKFYLGSKLHVVVNTPELAKVVLREQDEIFANHVQTVASSVITYGGQDILFSKNNANWRHLRKILVYEVLNNKNLEACRNFRKDEVRKTIKNIFNIIGTAVNVNQISFLTSSNVVTKMVWENTIDEGSKESNLGDELKMVATKCVQIFNKINLSDIFPILAWFDLQGVERDIKEQLTKVDQIFTSMIEDRKKYNSINGVGHEGKKDFLQTLLELKDNEDGKSAINIYQLKSLLMDIMIGGTDTVTTLIEWVMTEIIHHDKVMNRVHEELAEVVGLDNIVEEHHLPKLQYLDATIKETLRLHPISTLLVPRSSSQDCTVGGYTVPKGSTIFVNAWSIHRDPRYWDNPLDFNPERFLTNDGTTKWDLRGNNLNFLPFGSGKRVCPGIPLAEKMQMYILASLLHSFDWSLPKGETLDLSDRFGALLTKRKPLIVIPSQRLSDVSMYM